MNINNSEIELLIGILFDAIHSSEYSEKKTCKMVTLKEKFEHPFMYNLNPTYMEENHGKEQWSVL